jgi:hypothetical protein
MRRLLVLLLLGTIPGAWAAAPAASPTPGLALSQVQWEAAVGQFEGSISALTKELARLQGEIARNQKETESLEGQVTRIRQSAGREGGVFDQLRLNRLLNDLKDRLEKNSTLQKQWTEKQKELEQKGLSLISLYTDRIELELESADHSPTPSAVSPQYGALTLLIQKRHRVQQVLQQYQSKKEKSLPIPLEAFKTLKSADSESLQLTLDLLRDKKRSLEEDLEKEGIEMDEIRNEIKLQGKMREFMEGIKRMNQDSDAPVEGSKRNDLSRIYGSKQTKKLESRLAEIQAMTAKNKAMLADINQMTSKVQDQLAALGERKRK